MTDRTPTDNWQQQFYHVNAIDKKLIHKVYRWDLPIEELKNYQNVLPPAKFVNILLEKSHSLFYHLC